MTTPVDRQAPAVPVELDYGRTVDRSLVHRDAVSEVFVTDVRPVADRLVSAAVQLPLNHGYYNDHVQRPAAHDALLLLEAGRQAAIAGSHVHIGLSPGTLMIVDTFRLELPGFRHLLIGAGPGRLRIDTDYIGEPTRRGRYRKGKVVQRFLIDGTAEVGEHEMDVLFLNAHEHEVLRRAQRGGPAPLTSDRRDREEASGGPPRVAPGLVGRALPVNVTLSDPRTGARGLSAAVTPRFDNRSLFDHVYDHLPAMTLVEAARQIALLATGAPLTTYATGFTAAFSRFAELDAPLRAEAPAAEHRAGPGELPVRFVQDGAEIARITVTTTGGAP
ncbi:AfsA-related hotdog domain-containing protein [Streptomyces sp. NPDC049040]|uniref:AfsA-related hotdog domain-containing protein n=1 Tax=Streptomyces sp. NPDC049040 TaxID=3365593 RepID=UPI0037195E56